MTLLAKLGITPGPWEKIVEMLEAVE